MTSIRIAIAAALAAAAVCIGGVAHAGHSQTSTAPHSTVVAVRQIPEGPVLCCD